MQKRESRCASSRFKTSLNSGHGDSIFQIAGKGNLIRTADCILKLLSRQNKGDSEESTAIKKYSGPWWSYYGVLCMSFLNRGTTIE